MKRVLTIVCEFDDAPYFDEVLEREVACDTIGYALDLIRGACCPGEFVEAKLDNELLVDRNGFASEELRKSGRHKTLGLACFKEG